MLPFRTFLDSSNHHPDIDFAITVVEELPNFSQGPLQFDACHGLWRLYHARTQDSSLSHWIQRPNNLLLARSSPKTSSMWMSGQLGKRLRGEGLGAGENPQSSCRSLSADETRERGRTPPPFGRDSVTHRRLHFPGASGTGKSTLSGFFNHCGASVLSDERMIIRKCGETYHAQDLQRMGNEYSSKNESGIADGTVLHPSWGSASDLRI